MHRSFVHLELNTGDTDAAKSFYRQVFQWDFQEIPMPDGTKYTQIRPPSGPGGGMQIKLESDAPTAWLPYVGVESVEATVERVVAAGGNVIEPYQPVPGFGALAIVEDPTGACFGLWETAMPVPVGDPDPGEPPISEDEPDLPLERPKAKRPLPSKASAKKTKAAPKASPPSKASAKKEKAAPKSSPPSKPSAKKAKAPAAKQSAAETTKKPALRSKQSTAKKTKAKPSKKKK